MEKTFKSTPQWKRHSRVHHNGKDIQEYTTMEKTFKSTPQWKRHSRVHHNGKHIHVAYA